MSRVYFAVFLVALTYFLMSLEAEGQPTSTNDESEYCDSNLLYTSEQVANLIRKTAEKLIASNQQQPTATPKQSLVSALVCEYRKRCQLLLIFIISGK